MNLTDFNKIKITDVCGIYTLCHTHSNYIMKDREWHGISLAKSGKIQYTLNGTKTLSDQSRIIFLPKGATYRLECIEPGEFTLVNFQTTAGYAPEEFFSVKTNHPDDFLSIHQKLMRYAKDGLEYNTPKSYSLLYSLIAHASDEYLSCGMPPILNRGTKYISENISNPNLSVSEISAYLGISEIYLRNIFKRYMHLSPKKYITDMRMKRANILLSTTPKSVSEIGEKCGFSGVYNFCRAYKTHFGYTPTEYRRLSFLI